MITKTYIAYGFQLETQIIVPGRGIADLNFIPYSNYESGRGGSIYETSDEELQAAIESDPRFGSKFHLKSVNGMSASDWAELQASTAGTEAGTVNEETTEKKGLIHVPVNNIMDAKTYLIENYNWEPKGRQTKSSIKSVAETYGVIFEGI